MSLLARRATTPNRFVWLVALVIILLAGIVHAAGTPSARGEDARAQLERFVRGTERATGRFVQVADAAGETSSGVFAFSRPGRFRWEITEPYPQLMIADGEHVYFYDVDLAQVTIRPMDQAIAATPAALLFGDGDLDAFFDIELQGEHDGLHWLKAIPRESDAGFRMITLGFANDLPARMSVLDAFDRTTVFTFSDVTPNPAADPGRYRFEVPENVDVVRP